MPIYQQERIDQLQKNKQRCINVLKEKVKQEKLLKQQQEEQIIEQYNHKDK